MYILTALFLSAVNVCLYVYWYLKKSRKFFDQYGIPSSPSHWLFGHMKDAVLMRKPLWVGFQEMYRMLPELRFAGVYTLHRPFVMIRDPDLIKLILVKDFFHFNDHGFTINKEVEPMANTLFNMKGNEWKNLRIKLTGTFTSGKMKIMFPLMKNCAQDIKPLLTECFTKNQPFEAKDLFARFATDVIGSCAFGIDTHSLQNPESEFLIMSQKIFRNRWQATLRVLVPNLPASYVKTFGLQFFSPHLCEYFMKLVKEMVIYREQNNISRGDFLDLLIALKKEKNLVKTKQDQEDLDKFMSQIGEKSVKNDAEITIEVMAAQCFLFFLAGFEGASTTLTFLLFELAQKPEIQTKLRNEITTTLATNADGQFTYEMMKKMPYLDMAVAETLRKYPLGGMLFRKCTQDYKIPNSDAVIKKGTPVVIPTLGLHYDEKYFEKPQDFYPEHFTAEAKLKRHHFAYLPFGEGPRVCIAERFARMQIIIGAVYLLKDFIFEVSPKTKVPLEIVAAGGTVVVKGGVWLKCRPL